MFSENSFVRKFTDMMSEGFIFIDNKGKIQIYNNKAKEIFGVLNNDKINHKGGKIKKGDIVIIGDNCIGKDDGNLTSKDLNCIGINEDNIKIGDALVAVGVFKENHGQLPVYKYLTPIDEIKELKLTTRIFDLNINCTIDFKDKEIKLQVDENIYSMKYLYAIGHILVLDGKTKKVKFCQTHGYTARGESLNHILKGKYYRAKGKYSKDFNVIGKDIFEIHSGGNTIEDFYKAATCEDISYENEFKEINGRPTICTLAPVKINGERAGASLKVEDISELKKAIRERDEALLNLEKMERRLKEDEKAEKLLPEIIGDSKELLNVKKLVLKASQINSTVLLLGESGTGKSFLAKVIHKNSKNRDKPFISVNCGSIPENLIESELFGYEDGAFTGARREGKLGLFELANGGTIFLDEIGEISPALQVKLLQVLQDKSFIKIGGKENKKVDVRIIVATNKNLEDEIIKGNFREDLYYRINVFPIWIPPLRARKQDIYQLVEYLLPLICKKNGCKEKRISGEAMRLLLNYNWPGNIRELENILERAVNISEGNTLLSIHIPIEREDTDFNNNEQLMSLKSAVEVAEKKAILKALAHYNGNKTKAMKALKIGKTSFYEKLKKYNINYNQ